jgi:hypothetical protein
MAIKRGRLNWGVFFITVGAVVLAFNQDVVSTATLADAWRLWPLILVGFGIGLILRRTPAYFVGGIIVAACFGLIVGSAFAVGPQVGCGHGGGPASTVTRDGSFDGSGNVNVELQCGTATVTTSSDSNWHVNATNSSGTNAEVSYSGGTLSVAPGHQNDWWNQHGTDNWIVSLPSGPALGLSVSVNGGDAHINLDGVTLSDASFSLNAGSLHADLTGSHVSSISVSTNVGASSVVLDGDTSLNGSLSTNVGSMNLCYPSQLGVRLQASESLGSNNFGSAGLSRVGDAWQTPNYDTAAAKADLSVSTSVGSLTLNPAGGCR